MKPFELEELDGLFAVCKGNCTQFDWGQDFLFVGKTDEEVSVVCREGLAPAGITDVETGWKAIRVKGQLDFSLVGVLSDMLKILADEGISVFVISTYLTDYILVRKAQFPQTRLLLQNKGYRFFVNK